MKKRVLGKIALALSLLFLAACSDEDAFKNDNQIGIRGDGDASDVVQEVPVLPKKQTRAVWIATVYGLDWPNGSYSATTQKRLYTSYLDLLVKYNINMVFFQVRPMADAFYDSPYEPWSQYITGVAGRKPGYDVLKFMIDEAHKRCISFHAWINPYRIAKRNSASDAFPTLSSKIPKELTKDYNTIRVYNPALPETRARLDSIVKDLIVKYDVDGVHMDDYFYPSLTSGESMNDDAEFKKYKGSYTDINNWRRNNVTLMVRSLQQTIRETRKEVVFSISPQGNIENDYNGQYADVNRWMTNGWLDVMIPQIYYGFQNATCPYSGVLREFDSMIKVSGIDLYVGLAAYKIGNEDTYAGAAGKTEWQQNSDLLSRMVTQARDAENYKGFFLYSYSSLVTPAAGVKAQVQAELEALKQIL